jgi:PIN domain nuclease of toxin-antitoxin system
MRFLFDSHTLLWTIYEPFRLSASVQSVIANTSNDLLISHISIWELTDKAAKFRLPVAGFSVDRIVDRITGLGGTLLPVELADIVASVKLPHAHGDPMDRALIAQAQRHNAILLSRDRKFNLYDVPVFWQ